MKNKTLHMIGNAHIDPVWLWRWDEGMREVHATFRSALDLMKDAECGDFIFTASSAVFYAWIEENDPPMFSEIKQRVAEGRWQIVGGWWIEPDCNIPCGESFVRQALYGQRYFKAKLGEMATVGYCPDSFGHNATLPQIPKKSRMDYYIFMRPYPHEKDLPGRLFWWESQDGSRVLAYHIPYSYETSGRDLDVHIQRCSEELAKGYDKLMCFYGVGNHGGGPTRENLASIRRLNDRAELPCLVLSSAQRFFAGIATDGVPTVVDELQHHARGCFAAHSGVKRWNRQAENALIAAEKFSVLANWVTGLTYPTELTDAWITVLFNQFHDILAGSCIEAAYEDVRNTYGQSMTITDRAIHRAAQAIAHRIRIPREDAMTPLVVFNPHVWTVKACVEFEMNIARDIEIIDDRSNAIPAQEIQPHATVDWRRRFCFVADLPAMGYRVYRVHATDRRLRTDQRSNSKPEIGGLESDFFHLELDPESGCIAKLRDKNAGIEVFDGEAAKPIVLEDLSDTWGHGVERFDQVVGEFAAKRITLVEDGEVRSTVRVESEYGNSWLIQDFAMYRTLKQIDVRASVNWEERHKALKLRFPVKITEADATFEIPYGHIQRAMSGEEEPGQSWVDVSGTSRDSGKPYGLSLLNDGKYSLDVTDSDIGLTVLRSPIYAHHEPAIPDPQKQYTFMDQGIQYFQYSLVPHSESWQQAGIIKRAAELNQQPIIVIETHHPDGTLPQQDSFISVNQDNVIISTVKQAEDGDDWILRCYETARRATHATIQLPKLNRVIHADFGPAEIKTFRVSRDIGQPIIETNLLEERL